MNLSLKLLQLRFIDPQQHTIAERYKIVAWLGAGGYGAVVKAIDHKSKPQTEVALKIYQGEMGNYDKIQLFKREFELIKRINHPSLPRVYGEIMEAGSEKRPCFAMELLESFDEEMSKVPNEELDEWVARFMLAMCDILQKLHKAKIYHRDIKLENIMRRAGKCDPVLIDFGIAVDPTSDDLLKKLLIGTGTPGDAPREQFLQSVKDFNRDDMSKAIDIHALGNLIGDCFSTREARLINEKSRSGRSSRTHPVTPPHWLRIESICRARNWQDRYQNISELREAITNRKEDFRDWIDKQALLRIILSEQESIDEIYLVGDEEKEVESVNDLVIAGNCLSLARQSLVVRAPFRLASGKILCIEGPGRIEMDLSGDDRTLVILRNGATLTNRHSCEEHDSLAYYLSTNSLLRFPSVCGNGIVLLAGRIFRCRRGGAHVFFGDGAPLRYDEIETVQRKRLRDRLGEGVWKKARDFLPKNIREPSMSAVFKKELLGNASRVGTVAKFKDLCQRLDDPRLEKFGKIRAIKDILDVSAKSLACEQDEKALNAVNAAIDALKKFNNEICRNEYISKDDVC